MFNLEEVLNGVQGSPGLGIMAGSLLGALNYSVCRKWVFPRNPPAPPPCMWPGAKLLGLTISSPSAGAKGTCTWALKGGCKALLGHTTKGVFPPDSRRCQSVSQVIDGGGSSQCESMLGRVSHSPKPGPRLD